jgi:CRISPR-associated protein Cmr4
MIYEQMRHWLWAIDPLHVGMGRQYVSRIDLPVAREQGTRLPVIPGTSLSGVCRAYAEIRAKSGGKLTCAGKGGPEGKDHCGKCPVCFAFGFSRGNEESRQGLVQIGTAHILFFPIATTQGPVWITCARQLQDAALMLNSTLDLSVNNGSFRAVHCGGKGSLDGCGELDLGWLYLKDQKNPLDREAWAFLACVEDGNEFQASLPQSFSNSFARSALVPDELFGTLVNDNLEVRTLVSIDPATGAAEEGALFTYEAIPRSTLLWFDVVYTNPLIYSLDGKKAENNSKTKDDTVTLAGLRGVVKNGFALMKYLGLGGMNTRGMGRADIRPAKCEAPATEAACSK